VHNYHAIKMFVGSTGVASRILQQIEVTGQLHALASLSLRKESLVSNEKEVGRLRRREKSLAPAEN
jgi:hypothetical protein